MGEQTGKILTYAVLYLALHFGLSLALSLVGVVLPKAIEAPVRIAVFKLLFLIYAALVAKTYFGKREIDVTGILIFWVMFLAFGIFGAVAPHSVVLELVLDVARMCITYMFILYIKYGEMQKMRQLPILTIALASCAVQFFPTLTWAAVPVLFCKSTHI